MCDTQRPRHVHKVLQLVPLALLQRCRRVGGHELRGGAGGKAAVGGNGCVGQAGRHLPAKASENWRARLLQVPQHTLGASTRNPAACHQIHAAHTANLLHLGAPFAGPSPGRAAARRGGRAGTQTTWAAPFWRGPRCRAGASFSSSAARQPGKWVSRGCTDRAGERCGAAKSGGSGGGAWQTRLQAAWGVHA